MTSIVPPLRRRTVRGSFSKDIDTVLQGAIEARVYET